jgi:hypothetical protein
MTSKSMSAVQLENPLENRDNEKNGVHIVEMHCLISLYILVTIMKLIIKSEQVSLKEN